MRLDFKTQLGYFYAPVYKDGSCHLDLLRDLLKDFGIDYKDIDVNEMAQHFVLGESEPVICQGLAVEGTSTIHFVYFLLDAEKERDKRFMGIFFTNGVG